MEQGNNNREKDDSRFLGGKDKKKDKKYYGKFLIFIIFVILCIEYYAYVFEVMIKYMNQKNFYLIVTLLTIFHILVLLLLIAFISTMNTNPGEIPLYWGFYIGDDDYKGNITSKNRTSKDDFDIDKELDFDDDEEEDENIKDNNINITVKGGNNTISRRRISRHSKIGKNNTRLGKLKANIENIKSRMKKRKKLSRRQLIFSRFCKYIFYSIVLFTIYILVKKLLEFFEIIDPEGATEVKIENDEMANLKKTSGNKIS